MTKPLKSLSGAICLGIVLWISPVSSEANTLLDPGVGGGIGGTGNRPNSQQDLFKPSSSRSITTCPSNQKSITYSLRNAENLSGARLCSGTSLHLTAGQDLDLFLNRDHQVKITTYGDGKVRILPTPATTVLKNLQIEIVVDTGHVVVHLQDKVLSLQKGHILSLVLEGDDLGWKLLNR